MPKYTLEISGKTYDIESEKALSDDDLISYSKQISAPAVQPRGVVPSEMPRLPTPMAMGGTQTYGTTAQTAPTAPGAILGGLGAGAARGVAGLTELGARAVGAEGLQRSAKAVREAAKAGVKPYAEEYPFLTGAGEFAGEAIVPTAAVIKAGQAIKAVGSLAPSLARFTAPTAEALSTGGFSPKVANKLAKIAGGAAAGGATGAILSGDIGEEAALSAALGGAAPIVLPAITKLGYAGVGKAVDYVTGMLPKVKAGEIARRVAGPKLDEIKAATAAAPDLSAGQAAAGVDSAAWQSLAETAASKDPAEFLRVLKETQGAARVNQLARLAGGESQAAAMSSRKEAQKALSAVTVPMMETELKAAGTAGEAYKRIVPKMQQKYDSMKQALQETGQLYAYENQARQALLQKLNSPTPGWVSARTIDQLEQNVLKARAATQEMNAMKWQRQDEGEFLRRQLDSLASYGLKPIDTEKIVSGIAGRLQDPRIGVSDENSKVLLTVADKINEWTAKGGGYIDPKALHEIRKTVVNEVIQKELAGRDPRYVQKRAAEVLGQVRPLIDDAIEAAGGSKWRDALAKHAEGMRKIEQQELAAKALQLYEQSPNEFVELVKGNKPDLVESVFGRGQFDIRKEMGDQYASLKRIADEAARDIKIGKLATEGRKVAAEQVQKEAGKFRLPGLLSTKATIANKTLDMLEGKVNEKTMNALVEGMRTGKSANQLLNSLPANERLKVLQVMQQTQRKVVEGLPTTIGIGQSITESER